MWTYKRLNWESPAFLPILLKFSPNTDNNPPKKMKNTLLRWCTEGILHLSLNEDDLYHPMILSVHCIFHELHILLRIVQFDNLRLFPRTSPLLTRFGQVGQAVLGTSFLGPFRQVDGRGRPALHERNKCHP